MNENYNPYYEEDEDLEMFYDDDSNEDDSSTDSTGGTTAATDTDSQTLTSLEPVQPTQVPTTYNTSRLQSVNKGVSGGMNFMQAWNNAYKEPEKPDEKKMAQQSALAVLGDLGQMIGSFIAVSGGAAAPTMTPLSGQVAAQQQRAWYLYDQKKEMFRKAQGDASLRNWQYEKQQEEFDQNMELRREQLRYKQALDYNKLQNENQKFIMKLNHDRELAEYKARVQDKLTTKRNNATISAAYVRAGDSKDKNQTSIYTKSWGRIDVPDKKILKDNIAQMESVLKSKGKLPVYSESSFFGMTDPMAREQARYSLIYDAVIANIEDPDIAREFFRINDQSQRFKVKNVLREMPLIKNKKGITGNQFNRYGMKFKGEVMNKAVTELMRNFPDLSRADAEEIFINHIEETTEQYPYAK